MWCSVPRTFKLIPSSSSLCTLIAKLIWPQPLRVSSTMPEQRTLTNCVAFERTRKSVMEQLSGFFPLRCHFVPVDVTNFEDGILTKERRFSWFAGPNLISILEEIQSRSVYDPVELEFLQKKKLLAHSFEEAYLHNNIVSTLRVHRGNSYLMRRVFLTNYFRRIYGH
jgi:hypothetical protein